MPIVVHCPKCSVRLTLGDDRAGTSMECPKCSNWLTVPKPTLHSAPAPKPTPVPSPPFDEDDDFLPPPKIKSTYEKQIQKHLALAWKIATSAVVGVSLLCFFLPWIRLNLNIPANPWTVNNKIELASQSGFQITFALATLHPILERMEKEERRYQRTPIPEPDSTGQQSLNKNLCTQQIVVDG